ncbi:Uncharacterised protein [Mycobacterium tuberculosis]|uniref:Uncharacterized protein n=1 Tax=Mycobacterium tuberculosis TaxID=1773 RepID=A0A0T7M170_MYCTX|nr:Uncharacterised protein [Mycobacterium tuberculosis]CKR67006.1 Uncharacterised protein [Mycobacterium tuberculosis]CKR75123.1 Uncharacterised protein [Mycobacterium tuberculosis]CKS01306.1 Uncharacterised protein [Mycobacterium tuberculosis]CKS24207.1 Uncharacterised protein [Mycobacterium tuberculosis]
MFGFGVAGEHDFAGILDDTLVERSPLWPPHQGRDAAPRQCIRRSPQPGFGVVTDGAASTRQCARQIESVTETQRGADLVGELGQQVVASAARHPVQFGAHIQQGAIRTVQRTRRQVRVADTVPVDELGESQRV